MNVLIALSLFCMIGTQTTSDGYLRIQHGSGDEESAARLIQFLQHKLDSYSESFGLELDRPVTIILAYTDSEFEELQPDYGRAPKWAGGVAYPSSRLIIVKAGKAARGGDVRKTLLHEIAHVLFGDFFTDENRPVWLEEGMAMHLADDWNIGRQFAIARAVVSDRLIGLTRLVSDFPEDTMDAETAYAESYYFLLFLKDRFGKGVFKRLVELLGMGVKAEYALQHVTGTRFRELERQYLKWLKNRFSILWFILNPYGYWLAGAVILLIARVKIKRAAARKMAEWEEEDNEET